MREQLRPTLPLIVHDPKRIAGLRKRSANSPQECEVLHIHNSNGLVSWRWLHAKEARGLAALDTAPEFPLAGNDQGLMERTGMGGDLDTAQRIRKSTGPKNFEHWGQAARGRTSRAIASPLFIRAFVRSCMACRFIQNSGPVP